MRKILAIVILLTSVTFSVSAEDFHVFFKRDFPGQQKTQYYNKSCVSCIPKVRIESVDTTNLKSAIRKKHRDGNIVPQAEFVITSFNKDKSLIHFTDGAGADRNDVGSVGVKFNIIIEIEGKTYPFDERFMEIIPSTSVRQDDSKSAIISAGKYDKKNNLIQFESVPFNTIKGYQISNGKIIANKIEIQNNSLRLKESCDALHIMLSSDNDYCEDFEISISDFGQISSWWDSHKNQVIDWSIIIGGLIAIIVLAIFFIINRRSSRGYKKSHDSSQQIDNENGYSDNPGTIDIIQESNLASELVTTITAFKQSVDSYYGVIKSETNTIKAKLNDVQSLVSNTDDKRKITELIKCKEQLEKDKKELDDIIADKEKAICSLKDDVKQKDNTITNLESKIKEAENASTIVGADRICGYEHFLAFSRHILDSCAKAEQLCYNFRNSLTADNQSRLEGYFCEFLFSKPANQISEWNCIISTLDLNGYIKAPQFSVYIKNKADKEKVEFLNKLFFEYLLRPYVSGVLVLLEQLRTSDSFGLVNPNKSEFEESINEILTLCKGEDISIEFHSLLKPINSYEMVEIADNLIPMSVEKNINKDIHDVLLYVQKYAVNSKVSDSKEKTICYINI